MGTKKNTTTKTNNKSTKKSTKKTHHTTKQTNLVNTFKGKLDIAKSGMGFVIVPNMENDILVFPTDFKRG